MNEIVGLALGLCIGAACRWFDIPVPAPPRITGALLVVAMTLGFLATDAYLAQQNRESAAAVAACEYPESRMRRKEC